MSDNGLLRSFTMSRPSQRPCQPSVGKELFEVLQSEAAHLERKELELTSQIGALSEVLVSVRSALSAIRTRASECIKRISPATRLPDETLLAIFEEAVLSQDVCSRRRVESAISCVSHRWQRIALHTPRLWTRVCVTPDTDECGMKLHLLRSAALPLDVEVWGWWDYRDSFTRPHHFEHTLAAVLPSASRWRRIKIGASCDTILTSLSFILRASGPFDALQQVVFKAQQPGQICPTTLLMGKLAPNLRSIDVENLVLTARSPCLHRDDDFSCFMGVTHLTLRLHEGDARALKTITELQGFRALLLRMSNLTSLSLYGELIHVTNLEDEGNITVPRLQTLILHPSTIRPRYLRNLVAMINAPDLRHFELVYPDSFTQGQDISDLLLNKGCEQPTPRFPVVERLVLNNAASITAAAAFIQAFPGVDQLTISGADVGIFNQPTWEATGGSWRNITKLALRSFQPDRLTLVVDWLDVITSNGEAQAPLVQGPITDCPVILHLYEELKRYTQIELLDSK
ncbi:hypothetical protein DEU56DRAFT_981617 [Suillus clintonianus]|uniref:uncharacterized protein n=1 Tax=Suillus clintonianus TaxID=1904413 RepID=UPI001B87B3AB|nr:uncharacterized protein DEU56DRAFT_981617 [Suillus clintonianus]KAG2132982.1 hypothetical protein DEU56DRAFT_981617 [Suillus clintonianus]